MNDNQPIARLKSGQVTVAVWRTFGESGNPMYAMRMQRSWMSDDGEWHNTTTVHPKHVDDTIRAFEMARTWIAEQAKAAKVAAAASETEADADVVQQLLAQNKALLAQLNAQQKAKEAAECQLNQIITGEGLTNEQLEALTAPDVPTNPDGGEQTNTVTPEHAVEPVEAPDLPVLPDPTEAVSGTVISEDSITF